MKKMIRTGLLAVFLTMGIYAAAQSPVAFISKIEPPIPQVLTVQGAVKVSYIDGLSNGVHAFSLVLENTTDNAVSFTWTVKDKSGNTVVDAHTMTLASHASVDYSSRQEMANALVILLPEGAKPGDYSVQINY